MTRDPGLATAIREICEAREQDERIALNATLRPCPFCGSGNVEIDFYGNEQQEMLYWALCHGCDAEGPPDRSADAARDRWNQRAFATIVGTAEQRLWIP